MQINEAVSEAQSAPDRQHGSKYQPIDSLKQWLNILSSGCIEHLLDLTTRNSTIENQQIQKRIVSAASEQRFFATNWQGIHVTPNHSKSGRWVCTIRKCDGREIAQTYVQHNKYNQTNVSGPKLTENVRK